MTLSFLPAAQDELIWASEYYDGREDGLGVRFRDEVSLACHRIVQDPFLWRE